MRAFIIEKYKGTLREAEVSEPGVGEHDVLIDIAAAGANQLDEKIRMGQFKAILPYKLPLVLGHDVAGTVIALGASVQGFALGDRVYARPRDHRIGGFAQRIAVDESEVALAPKAIDEAQAASLPLVALTAWQALVERGTCSQGKRSSSMPAPAAWAPSPSSWPSTSEPTWSPLPPQRTPSSCVPWEPTR